MALKAAAEGAATEETEDVIPRVEGEFIWDEDRPFHRCAPRREGGTERPPAHPAISHRDADVPRRETRSRIESIENVPRKRSAKTFRLKKKTFRLTARLASSPRRV